MRKGLKPYQFPLLLCFLLTGVVPASAQLTARFTSNITAGCAPLVVHFKDESTGNPTNWKWQLGNGTTSYFQNPSATYFNPGTYTVRLTVNNGNGSDSVIKVNYITVYASPIVDFVASDSTGCFPLNVTFTDKSAPGNGAIEKWLWDFGDGSTDSVQHPLHTYNNAGNFNVSLQVRNSNGCVSTLTRVNYIQLRNGVSAAFNFSSPDNCKPPTTIGFTNGSSGTGLLSYQWDFGDGIRSTLQSPTHSYISVGTYTVKLVTHNNTGCVDSIIKPHAITIGTVGADFSYPTQICAGETFQLINRSQPNPQLANWFFGDNTRSSEINPFKQFSNGGNYIIKLVSDFGACKDSISKNISVFDKPTANFSASNSNACKPPLTTVFASNSSNVIAYKWFFGDGDSASIPNPTHTYKNLGNYDVALIVTNSSGCNDTLRKKSFVRIQAPVAGIANLPQHGCAPFLYTAVSNSETVDSIIRYEWDFGDGTTEVGESPSHSYAAGTYTLDLIITTAGGCADTVSAPNVIRVGIKPQASLTALPRYSCAFQSIQFTDLSLGNVDTWLWHFGDGGTSTERNPSHIYQDTGYFDIILIVASNGCADSIKLDKYVYIKPPIAKFIDSSGCDLRFTRKFIDKSIGATSWNWDFGDGTTSIEENPVHIYASPGTYMVQLTVRNDTCEHHTQKPVVIIMEHADFTASDTVTCKGTSIQFSSKNILPENISSYQWDFGDGVIQYGGSHINHNYSSAGTYLVQLVITDINGCTDTLKKPNYIHVDGPTADFSSLLPGACLQQNVVFRDESVSDGTHSIGTWIWNYGDSRSDTLRSPPFQHAYSSGGNFTVTLVVTDSKGCIDSVVHRNSIVISSPKAAFYSDDSISCSNQSIRFTSLSTGPSLQSKWEFGDGQTSTVANPVHQYVLQSDYTISLRVTDQYGCKDSVSKPNYVSIHNPVAQFSMSDSVSTCPPLVVNFSNQSQHFISYEWDFGDGTKSALQNPIHFYTYPGTYHPKLKVMSHGGCIDTVMKNVVVRGPQGTFVYDDDPACIPKQVNFVASTKDQVIFIWDFNDGETIVSGDSITTHNYTRMGDYLPKMILKDPQGCQVPIVGKDTIHLFGVDAMFTLNQQVVCDSGLVQFHNSSISNDLITNYSWLFGDGTTSTAQNPSHWYGHSGKYPIQLIVKTLHQCSDTMNTDVPLRIVTSPIGKISGDTAGCVPASMQFNGLLMNSDTSVLHWQWNFGNNSTSSIQHPSAIMYSTASSYDVRLTVTNSSNCTDTSYWPVVIYPLPVVDAGPDKIICRYQPIGLQATGGATYNWWPTPTLSCNICDAPIAHPDSTILYHLQAQNVFGCAASDSVLITVNQPFKIETGKGDTLCKGDSYTMTVSGAEYYTWMPSLGLDDMHSSHPRARPDTTVLYSVIGRDNQSCFADTGYVRVTVYPYPLVNAGPDQTVIGGTSVTLKPVLSPDVQQIKWLPDKWLSCYNCAEPVASPKESTRYTVMVSNEGGYLARSEVSIFVVCAEGNLYLPNTFSPNGDGLNDVFYPRGKGIYAIRNFRVFDRWGELVFSQANFQVNDISKGWDGTYHGKLASQDVYVYTVDVICENNFVFSYKGNVALIR
jgi:gliding motility-associated-like protein